MKKLFLMISAMCGAAGLSVAPVSAQSSLSDIVSIEILDGGLTERGTHRAAVRMILAEGWKTYWRAPGDSGIPPRFEWAGSRNVEQVSIFWPAPKVYDQDGLRTIGYADQMVLPLEITMVLPGQPLRLAGEVEFGICEDICVPAMLSFDMQLDPEAPPNPAIAAALAAQPYSAAKADVSGVTCRLSPSEYGLELEALITMPSAGGSEDAVVEPGDDRIWAAQATTRRRGDTLRVVSELSHVSGSDDFVVDRSQLRITVLGKSFAVDIMGCAQD